MSSVLKRYEKNMPKRKIIMKINIAKSLLDKYFAIEINNNFNYIF